MKEVEKYCGERNISTTMEVDKEPQFPEEYGVVEREHFYKKFAWNGWPGALGIDSVLVAYDAFLSSNGSW